MKTIKNPTGYLQAIKRFLKDPWNSDETIENRAKQFNDKPELLEKILNKDFKPTITWMFSIKYPKNATEEEKNMLIIKAIEEHQAKQSLANSTENATV